MTTDTTAGKPRANRYGSECPPWCTQDHAKLLVTDPAVYADVHSSDHMAYNGPFGMHVSATQDPRDGTRDVFISCHGGYAAIDALQTDLAERFAGFLEALADTDPSVIRLIADQVRAAAAVARESE